MKKKASVIQLNQIRATNQRGVRCLSVAKRDLTSRQEHDSQAPGGGLEGPGETILQGGRRTVPAHGTARHWARLTYYSLQLLP